MPPCSDNGKQSLGAVSQSEAMLSGGRDSTGCSPHTNVHTRTQRSVSGLPHSHPLGAKKTHSCLYTFRHRNWKVCTFTCTHGHTHSHTRYQQAHACSHIGGGTVADTVTSLLIKEHEQKYIPSTSWAVILTFTQVRADLHTHTQMLKAHVPLGM